MSVKIIAVASQLPEYSRKTEDIIPMIDQWLEGEPERFIKKVKKIFEGAQVDRRYSIMSPEDVFSASSFAEKNEIYKREAIVLSEAVLRKTLSKASWDPEDIDFIITVSCTGIMIPSLDAYLINRVKLRQDIIRLPVTEMGCAAGVSAIIYAKDFLKANPGKRAAIISFESPTATFQLDDHSMPNIVSAAIFGDGAACVLMSSEDSDLGPEVIDGSMYHFFDAEHMMGFSLENSGLKMVLDVEVPETIEHHFGDIVHPFLARNATSIEQIDHLVFHPGGKKIIMTVESLFGALGKNIDQTRAVLRDCGNMSSATVLYVLEKIIDNHPKKGDKGLMLSFGPGFSAQRVLLQW